MIILKELTAVELISLHKAIHDRIKKLGHDLSWYERMSERNADYVPKLAIAQTEYDTLVAIRILTSEELTLRDFKGNLLLDNRKNK